MKKLLALLLFFIPFIGFSQGEFSIIDVLNICIAKPAYHTTTKKYPVIIFFPRAREIGTDKNKLVQYGVNAYVKQGWDLKAGGVEFIAISIQPKDQYPRPFALKPTIAKVLASVSYNPNYVVGTGLSRGAWVVNNVIS